MPPIFLRILGAIIAVTAVHYAAQPGDQLSVAMVCFALAAVQHAAAAVVQACFVLAAALPAAALVT